MIFYKIARVFIRLYLKIFYKWRIYGAENVPNNGSVILIVNHINIFDPLVVACSIDRQVHFMAKDELFKIPILKRIITSFGAFPIKRGGSDRKAIKTGLELLKNDKIMGIFPEGTRSKTGEIGKGLPGAALFALKTDAAVIPIGLSSSYKFFKPISINFGKPICLEAYKQERLTSEDINNAINHMMDQIKNQIDEINNL